MAVERGEGLDDHAFNDSQFRREAERNLPPERLRQAEDEV